ncbi:MAG: BMP family ABC transporter substrate-binding protein [Treponema sp.]|nr:MAG: BMP family ABC transporter substrate-binding protein [Treponema sp.]
MRKKLLVLIVAASLFMMFSCSKNEDGKVEASAGDEKKSKVTFALVTDTGGIDDRSFNQGTWEGILRAGKELGAETVYAQSNSDADYIPNLSTFAEDEHDIIVAAGFLFEKAISEVSANFPDTHFLIIDMVVGERDNVVSAIFAANQGSFLAGVAAAQAAKEAGKNAVGFIGGGDFGLIHNFEAGFEHGVKTVDPGIEVKVDYVGDFSDAGKGQSLASKMYDAGAYVIYHAAGGAGNGLIKEAKDRRKNGQDVWVIGVDRDQYEDGIYEDGKSVMLTSMMKRVDVAAEDVCRLEYEGKFPGGKIIEFNIANNGVGLPENNPNMSAGAIKLVEEYKDKIKSGELTVRSLPPRLEK